jgi:cell division inhibitor SepF
MSALRRLKAYFGMVPAEEFDAAGLGAAEYDEYHPGFSDSSHSHQSRRRDYEPHQAARRFPRAGFDAELDSGFDSGFDSGLEYNSSLPTPAGQHVASRGHQARPPSCATDSRAVTSQAADSRRTEAAVRGSLAIDPAAAKAVGIDRRIETKTTVRQPFTPQPAAHTPQSDSLPHDELHPLARIVTLHPHSYNEARPIGERYREGNPVIMNLTAMEDRDAKRLVDFAAGLAFALRGSIDKVTSKVFLLSPPNIDVSAEDRRRIAEGRLFN